jgi:hypothetical protein
MTIKTIIIAAALAAGIGGAATAQVTPQGVKGIQNVTNAGFENFGTYAIRIDQFGTGSDGEHQAVITVRNKGTREAGLVASHIRMTLINANNEPRINFGDLYQPDVTGPVQSLQKFDNTIVLQPNEQARIRLAFHGTKGFVPKTVRLREYVEKEAVVTYTLD